MVFLGESNPETIGRGVRYWLTVWERNYRERKFANLRHQTVSNFIMTTPYIKGDRALLISSQTNPFHSLFCWVFRLLCFSLLFLFFFASVWLFHWSFFAVLLEKLKVKFSREFISFAFSIIVCFFFFPFDLNKKWRFLLISPVNGKDSF